MTESGATGHGHQQRDRPPPPAASRPVAGLTNDGNRVPLRQRPRLVVADERFLTTGMSSQHRVVIVWHADEEQGIRIIGAREATPRERRTYESGE